jgi:multiple sugar transport system permease protein
MRQKWLLCLPQGLTFCLVTLAWLLSVLPLVWMILSSFKAPEEMFQLPPTFLPQGGWQWNNYREVWERLEVARMVGNSLFVAGIVVTGQLFTSTVAGYVFARVQFFGHRLLFWLYILSMLVPYQLTLIPSFKLLTHLGLIDTYGALTVPFLSGALGTLIMRQQFLALPREIEEAGRLDGCTTWPLFRYILLPMVTPALKAVAAIMFLFSWNNLIWPLVMTHRAEIRTLPVGMALLKDDISSQWHLLMAGSVYATLPALIIIWLLTNGLQTLGPRLNHSRNMRA